MAVAVRLRDYIHPAIHPTVLRSPQDLIYVSRAGCGWGSNLPFAVLMRDVSPPHGEGSGKPTTSPEPRARWQHGTEACQITADDDDMVARIAYQRCSLRFRPGADCAGLGDVCSGIWTSG